MTEDLFQYITEEIDEIGDSQFLVEVEYVSVDPAMRGWISDATTILNQSL